MTPKNEQYRSEHAAEQPIPLLPNQWDYRSEWHHLMPALDVATERLITQAEEGHPVGLLICSTAGMGKTWGLHRAYSSYTDRGIPAIRLRPTAVPAWDTYALDTPDAEVSGMLMALEQPQATEANGLSDNAFLVQIGDIVVDKVSYVALRLGLPPILVDFNRQVAPELLAAIGDQAHKKPLVVCVDDVYKQPPAQRKEFEDAFLAPLRSIPGVITICTHDTRPLPPELEETPVYNPADETVWSPEPFHQQLKLRPLWRGETHAADVWEIARGNPFLLIACAAAPNPEEGVAGVAAGLETQIAPELLADVKRLSPLDIGWPVHDLATYLTRELSPDHGVMLMERMHEAGIAAWNEEADLWVMDPLLSKVFGTIQRMKDESSWKETHRLAAELFAHAGNRTVGWESFTQEQIVAHHRTAGGYRISHVLTVPDGIIPSLCCGHE